MRRFTRPGVVAPTIGLILMATAVPSLGQSPSAATRAVEPAAECFAPSAYPDVECGYVIVPEARDGSSDRTIKLAYIRFKSLSTTPGVPLINGTGGPGSTALNSPDLYAAAFAPTLADRDVIIFSQRGTQHSEPFLGCDPYTQAYNDAYVQGLSEQDRLAYVAPFLKTCVEDLQAKGVDISAYNSKESAADVLDIVTALGYDHFDYAGQSYGTLLGQFVVEQAGDRLDAVVLDGVVPKAKVSQVQDGGDKTQRVFQAIFAACTQDPACAAAYPDPEGQLVALYDELQSRPIDLVVQAGGKPVTLKVDGTLMINGLYSAIYGAPNLANLPRALALASSGHPEAIADYVGANISAGHTARVEHYSVVCWDDPATSLDQAVTADDLLAPYVRLAESNTLEYIDSCPVVTAPSTVAGLDDPVVSDVPALFLSGGLDPTTPASQAAEVAEGFAHNTQLTNPAGTHIQMIYDPCFQGIVAAFLRDPSATPDSSCVAKEPALPAFVVDQTISVPSQDAKHTLTFTVPSDYVTTNGVSVDHLNKRYLLPVFGTAGQSAADAATAAAAQFGVTSLVAAGPTNAGTHDATLYQGTGEIQGFPITVDVVVAETAEGAFGVLGAGLAELQSAMRTVDLPVSAASLTIDGN